MGGLRSRYEAAICRLAGRLGLDLVPRSQLLRDINGDDVALMDGVRPYTMTGPERLHALIQAVRYVVAAGVQGDVVECGVWRGGSMMAVASTLLRCDSATRRLWLYDTFEGMTKPTDVDVDIAGRSARDDFARHRVAGEDGSSWYAASLDEVRSNMARTGYPSDLVSFVPGQVEQTLPDDAPDNIALLRLDTDWYDSTKAELATLFPRLAPGGILIIDDYGHWEGCRRAVDEYLREQDVKLLLNRIDYTGRIAVKPGSPVSEGAPPPAGNT
jgi:O-methyltransferase